MKILLLFRSIIIHLHRLLKGEIKFNSNRLNINSDSFLRLNPGKWLNDEVNFNYIDNKFIHRNN
jgi:hypothetical protein